jgi:hypothetical protein
MRKSGGQDARAPRPELYALASQWGSNFFDFAEPVLI